MAQVFVAAGSNVEPERHLTLAAIELQRVFGEIHFSPWYRNRAVGFEGDDFINFVVGFETAAPVQDVVARLREIETLCGRPREAAKWAPRSMDLDILMYDNLVCEDAQLKLPRPDLLKRAYMLGPMADLAPEVVHPTAHVTIGELWERFDRGAHALEPVSSPLSPRSGLRQWPESGR
jgi:2-amino-4-hydroxy-6-hydroxymethyldihydropteridine diphosphokinase